MMDNVQEHSICIVMFNLNLCLAMMLRMFLLAADIRCVEILS
jgi:hypothetical protein